MIDISDLRANSQTLRNTIIGFRAGAHAPLPTPRIRQKLCREQDELPKLRERIAHGQVAYLRFRRAVTAYSKDDLTARQVNQQIRRSDAELCETQVRKIKRCLTDLTRARTELSSVRCQFALLSEPWRTENLKYAMKQMKSTKDLQNTAQALVQDAEDGSVMRPFGRSRGWTLLQGATKAVSLSKSFETPG